MDDATAREVERRRSAFRARGGLPPWLFALLPLVPGVMWLTLASVSLDGASGEGWTAVFLFGITAACMLLYALWRIVRALEARPPA